MRENQERQANQEKQKKSKEGGRDWYEWVQALVCSVLAVVVAFTFLIRLIGVDGHSMVPTLQDGDRLLVLDTEEDTYWLLDAEGNRTPLAASCETVLASDGSVTYGKNSGALVREADAGVEALATCRGYITDCCLIDGVFYLNQGLDLWVREDRLRFADATGENAEMVEKANAAGSLQGGRNLTLAFMPDGTVYLLHRS